MGGNAIKKNGVSICGRLPKDQYEMIKKMVLDTLSSLNIVCETVLELPGKESFGDIDILYISNPIVVMTDVIKNKFKVTDSKHIVINGYATSFAYEYSEGNYFQIDLLKLQSVEHLETSRFYFSYSDVGSILGRILNYYGLKLGDAGLWCDVYSSTNRGTLDIRNTLGKIHLTSNPQEICRYIGIDYGFWRTKIPKLGQGELEPIFAWIASCSMFKADIFKTLNSDHRARQEKRPFYNKFLEFIGIVDVENCEAMSGESSYGAFEKQMNAIIYFNKKEELDQLIAEGRLRDLRRSKFTGSDLIGYYKDHKINIEGTQVGDKINKLKKYCVVSTGCRTWEEFIDSLDRTSIQTIVHSFVCFDVGDKT